METNHNRSNESGMGNEEWNRNMSPEEREGFNTNEDEFETEERLSAYDDPDSLDDEALDENADDL